MDVKEVEISEINEIIERRTPLGKFYCFHYEKEKGAFFIGVDNSTGEAWTEEFVTEDGCKQWLRA